MQILQENQLSNILVSIVVPVYNAETTITKTTESILNQTHKNIEIIMVDDGSTDSSKELVDKLSETNSNIVSVHKSNSGVSSARNRGIDLSRGKYVMFVDADDILEPNHVEVFVKAAEILQVPIVYGGDHYHDFNEPINKNGEFKTIDSETIMSCIYECKIYMAVWNRIYNREYLNKNNIRFNEKIWYSEGMYFNMQCLSCTKTVGLSSFITYHYMNNPNSVMRKEKNLKNELNALCSIKEQRKFLNYRNRRLKTAHKFHLMIEHNNIRQCILNARSRDVLKNNKKIFKQSTNYIRIHLICALKIEKTKKQKLFWFLITIFPLSAEQKLDKILKIKQRVFK